MTHWVIGVTDEGYHAAPTNPMRGRPDKVGSIRVACINCKCYCLISSYERVEMDNKVPVFPEENSTFSGQCNE